MKPFLRWRSFLLISFICLYPLSTFAHDGWLEISPTIVERNQPATIALIQGNHSNEHKSYRIAGKWDQKYTTLVVVDAKAKQYPLTDRLIDFGEDAEAIGPKGPKDFSSRRSCPRTKVCTKQWGGKRERFSRATDRRSLRSESPRLPLLLSNLRQFLRQKRSKALTGRSQTTMRWNSSQCTIR